MIQNLKHLAADERGALVEYIIVVGLVALLAIAAFTAFGDSVTGKIKEQAKSVTSINGAAK